jgi:signal transduction histidine kinase
MAKTRSRVVSKPTEGRKTIAIFERLAAELGQTQDVDLAMGSVLRQGSLLLGAHAAAAIVLDEAGREQQRVGTGLSPDQLSKLGSACRSLIDRGEISAGQGPRVWPDLSAEGAPRLTTKKTPWARACTAVPLSRRGALLGVLFFVFDNPSVPSVSELKWTAVLASHATLALENARLFEAALRQAVELGAVYDTVTATVEGREVQPMLEGVIEQAARLLESHGGTIFLVDEDRRSLRSVAAAGLPAEPSGQVLQYGEGVTGRVAESRRPIMVEDLNSWPPEAPSRPGAESGDRVRVLSVPLIWRQSLIGVLEMRADAGRPAYSETDLRLAQIIAHQAANALGVARLVEIEREQRRMAEALQEASLAINRATGLDEVLESILEQVIRAFACDCANFQSYEEEQARVIRSRGYERFGLSSEDMAALSFSVDEHFNFYRMVKGEAVILADTEGEPTWIVLPGFEWIRSWAGVPIQFGGEILGFLHLDCATPGAFNISTARWLTAFAAHAAIAMHNARLYQKLTDEHMKLLQVYEIGQQISGSLVSEEILGNMLDGVQRAIGGVYGGVYRIEREPEDGALRVIGVVGRGIEERLRQSHPSPESLAEQIALAQAPLQEVKTYPAGAYWVSGVPLFVGDRVWGVALVWAAWRLGGEAPALGILAAAGQQAGLALLNAEQHIRVQRRLAEMTLLQGVASAIAQRLDTNAIVHTVTERLHTSLGYPAVQVFLREGDELVQREISGPRPVLDRLPITRGILGRVARTGVPACVEDVRSDPDYVAALVGTRAEMAVPIRIQDQVTGVINIETSDPSQVQPENLELLMVLADQVSVALQNAALYEEVSKNVTLLGERVKERTARLEEALEQVRSAERSKAMFVADISHELRTPLTNIGLYLDLLEMGKEGRRSEYMSILRHETERLGALIEQLLAISEYDTGQTEIRREPTDINLLIRMLVGDRERLIGNRGLRLVVDAAEDLALVPADQQEIMQVMTNLLTNAMNYTPSGGVITLQTTSDMWQGLPHVIFSIADTGPGIPEDERRRMFDRFFRGIVGRASGIPGTGLGLAICKEIVERHGGRLLLSTEGGKGTKVAVWLPEALPGSPS